MSGVVVAGCCLAGISFGIGISGLFVRLLSGKKPEVRRFANSSEDNRAWLVDHLRTARSEALIVSGSLDPLVYDKGFVRELESSLRRNKNLRVRFLCGESHRTNQGVNPLVEFVQQNASEFGERLQLVFIQGHPQQHFRVIDGCHLFVEDVDYHDADQGAQIVTTVENALYKANEYQRSFERLWSRPRASSPRKQEIGAVPAASNP